jgi:DNA repair protein RadC
LSAKAGRPNKFEGVAAMLHKSMGGSSEGQAERRKRVQVVRVQMIKERTATFVTNRITNPRDAAVILADFLAGADREHLVVLCLDNKHKVNAINVVAVGILNAAPVHPREVFNPAILANAAAVILGHNHPSGDPTPSPEDGEIARRLVEAGRILGIELLDSLIIGDDGKFVSFKEQGLL